MDEVLISMGRKGSDRCVLAKKGPLLDDPLAVEAAREQSKDKRIQELERKVRFLELRVLYLQKLKASVR
jgi:transposase